MNRFTSWVILLLLGILMPRQAAACAAAMEIGETISMTDESALIIWDKQKGIEHFIRRASFVTKASNFGFLVPTPSQPELAEVKDAIFDDLQYELEPKRIIKTGWKPNFTPLIFAPLGHIKSTFNTAASAMSEGAGGVEILESTQVAGYDATVLSADNPQSLAAWLKAHKYSQNPNLTNWLAPYVAAKWKITAFKIAKRDPKAPEVNSSLVRMSFRTKRPFYPYREPATARQNTDSASRSLRVFLLSDERMDGAIETSKGARAWPGQTTFSATIERPYIFRENLKLLSEDRPFPARLTAFEDWSSPRPGVGDVYFTTSTNQDVLAPKPIVTDKTQKVWIPLDVIVGVIALIVWAGLRIRAGRTSDIAACR